MTRGTACRNNWVTAFRAALAAVICALGCPPLSATVADASIRAARLRRFDRFLTQTEALYRAAGARPMRSAVRFGYVGADLIDPMVVTSETTHALERYASYHMLLRQSMSAVRPAMAPARPPGAKAPEDYQRGVDNGSTDATAAIQRALSAGDVWLTHGRDYRISHTIVVPSHRRILSDGTGTILVGVGEQGFPVTRYDPVRRYDGYADVLRIHDATDVALLDFRIQTPIADPRAPQPLLHGIDIRSAARVRVAGLELRGFPRATGIIRVNSSADVVLADNLIHASYTRALTRQVTGIEVDEARSADRRGHGVNSTSLSIAGNFVFGLLLDPRVYLETSLRGGAPLNDETTGIQLAAQESAATIRVDDNVIADVGQGIDLFTDDGYFARDTIVRAPEFALKMGHGASRNHFDHFRITASGIAAIVVYAVPNEPLAGNVVTDAVIDHPGAVIGMPVNFLAMGIEISTRNGANGAPRSGADNMGNVFDHIRVTGLPPKGTPGWHGVIACGWPSVPAPPGAKRNLFHDVVPVEGEVDSSGGCALVN